MKICGAYVKLVEEFGGCLGCLGHEPTTIYTREGVGFPLGVGAISLWIGLG